MPHDAWEARENGLRMGPCDGRALLTAAAAALLAACGNSSTSDRAVAADGARHYAAYSARGEVTDAKGVVNIYAATGASGVTPTAARARPLVYVPNSRSATVTVIDPATYRAVRTFATGAVPQHVVPAYDLSRLWVLNNEASTLTPIDPVTGREATPIHVEDPYNMYFTPDGRYAIVVAERRERLDFRDPTTMRLLESVRTDCHGIDHMEFTADGRYLIATCEFNGHLVKIDLPSRTAVGSLALDSMGRATASMPQDVRSSPDGSVFFVADMKAGGVHVVDPVRFRRVGFIPTGTGAHGLYPSRDGRLLYVTNRGWNTLEAGRHGPGSISVIDPMTRRVVATWRIPGPSAAGPSRLRSARCGR